jgi:LacI family transcriptional regulator
VRPETLQKISEAARDVGFHAAGLFETRLRQDLPSLKLGLLLLGEAHPSFFGELGDKFASETALLQAVRGEARVTHADWRDPAEIAAKLRALAAKVDVVAAVTIDHPVVTSAVRDIRAEGKPVFSVLTDFAAEVRTAYVGLNNRKAGRAAAWFVAHVAKAPGKVAILVGSSRFHGHEMREIGFRSYFREKAEDFTVIDTVVNPSSEEMAYESTRQLLKSHPDLVAIFVAGLGPEGAIRAIRETGRAGRLIAICNEITPQSRDALAEDVLTMIMETPLDSLCRTLARKMEEAVRHGGESVSGQIFLPFHMITPESI